MALSDTCFEFLEAVADAARKLADGARHYSSPDYPLRYGAEAHALRRLSIKAVDLQDDPEAVARLIRLAASVMHRQDTSPDSPELPERQREMDALVRLVLAELGPDDA